PLAADDAPGGDKAAAEGSGTRPPPKGAEGSPGELTPGNSPPPVLEGLTTDVRREDAFFELFCEKNMMSRFLELLRSPSSRYLRRGGSGSGGGGRRGGGDPPQSAASWGNNGGLDAVIRAFT
ncbi:unnamed protein product, partial [Ectocarpus sp. 12 AP-2014]